MLTLSVDIVYTRLIAGHNDNNRSYIVHVEYFSGMQCSFNYTYIDILPDRQFGSSCHIAYTLCMFLSRMCYSQ